MFGELPHGTIDGWTRKPHIRPHASGGGRGSRARGIRSVAVLKDPTTPAVLRAGGTLHAGKGGPVWAKAREDVALAEVVFESGEGWARVFRIEGINDARRDYLEDTWVRVEDAHPEDSH